MRLSLLVLVMAAACAGGTEPPGRKPHAPVEVTLAAVPIQPGLYRVTLEGRALSDLPSLDLELRLPDGTSLAGSAAGATAAGARRSLTTLVSAAGSIDVVGIAETPSGAATGSVTLGHPAAAKPTFQRVVITPFGPVAEVAR